MQSVALGVVFMNEQEVQIPSSAQSTADTQSPKAFPSLMGQVMNSLSSSEISISVNAAHVKIPALHLAIATMGMMVMYAAKKMLS